MSKRTKYILLAVVVAAAAYWFFIFRKRGPTVTTSPAIAPADKLVALKAPSVMDWAKGSAKGLIDALPFPSFSR